jgi:hypothetical protein
MGVRAKLCSLRCDFFGSQLGWILELELSAGALPPSLGAMECLSLCRAHVGLLELLPYVVQVLS